MVETLQVRPDREQRHKAAQPRGATLYSARLPIPYPVM